MGVIEEDTLEIDGQKAGFVRYGHGKHNILLVPGGVAIIHTKSDWKGSISHNFTKVACLGCYKKDYPDKLLTCFNEELVTLIGWDPPGYGTSRPPDRKQSINRCEMDARVAIKLMKQLELTPFTVVGWSEGGRTAIHVANQGREIVNRLVFFGSSTRTDARGMRIFQSMRNTSQWMPEQKAAYLEHYDEEFVKKQWADLCDLVSQVYEDLGGRFLCDQCLKNIKQPTLILYGGQDRLSWDPKYFLERLKDARVVKHAQGSHDLHLKFPTWFAEQLQYFVTQG